MKGIGYRPNASRPDKYARRKPDTGSPSAKTESDRFRSGIRISPIKLNCKSNSIN
jgi:hypothetical protein